MLAWAVNVARKQATKAQGELLFTRASAAGALDVEVGTRVQSAAINGHVYELITTVPGSFVDGQLQLAIPVEAIDAGSGFNLAPGYYAILPVPIPGIVQVVNTDNWLTSPGDDREPNEQLRLLAPRPRTIQRHWRCQAHVGPRARKRRHLGAHPESWQSLPGTRHRCGTG